MQVYPFLFSLLSPCFLWNKEQQTKKILWFFQSLKKDHCFIHGFSFGLPNLLKRQAIRIQILWVELSPAITILHCLLQTVLSLSKKQQ